MARKKNLEVVISAYKKAVDRLVLAYTQMNAEHNATLKIWDMIKEGVVGRDLDGAVTGQDKKIVGKRSYADAVSGEAGRINP